jgi:hypothetical protein
MNFLHINDAQLSRHNKFKKIKQLQNRIEKTKKEEKKSFEFVSLVFLFFQKKLNKKSFAAKKSVFFATKLKNE